MRQLVEIEPQTNDTDLLLFVAYMEDLTNSKGITMGEALRVANMRDNYVIQIKRYLIGKKEFRKKVSLSLLLHIAGVFDFPFDMGKYLPLLPELRQKYNKQD